jgi:hypothetical protein
MSEHWLQLCFEICTECVEVILKLEFPIQWAQSPKIFQWWLLSVPMLPADMIFCSLQLANCPFFFFLCLLFWKGVLLTVVLHLRRQHGAVLSGFVHDSACEMLCTCASLLYIAWRLLDLCKWKCKALPIKALINIIQQNITNWSKHIKPKNGVVSEGPGCQWAFSYMIQYVMVNGVWSRYSVFVLKQLQALHYNVHTTNFFFKNLCFKFPPKVTFALLGYGFSLVLRFREEVARSHSL